MLTSFEANGRVHFVAPKLFEMSLCLLGAQKEEGWFFVDAQFLFTVGGDATGMHGTCPLGRPHSAHLTVLKSSLANLREPSRDISLIRRILVLRFISPSLHPKVKPPRLLSLLRHGQNYLKTWSTRP